MTTEFLTNENIGFKLKEIINKKPPKELLISSPWITPTGLKYIENALNDLDKSLEKIKILIRVQNIDDLNITSPETFKKLKTLNARKVEIRLSKNIHAKMIIGINRENSWAVVSSSNITFGGYKFNSEAGILVTDNDTVQNIKKYFHELWKTSQKIKKVYGVVINPSKPYHIEAALFKELPLNSWVIIESDNKKYLGRIINITKWNRGFFYNVFNNGTNDAFKISVEEFYKVFEVSEDQNVIDWHITRTSTIISEIPDIIISKIKIIAEINRKKIESPLNAPDVGSFIKILDKKEFVEIFYQNKEYEKYILGEVISPSEEKLPFYINFKEILGKHMVIHGATGSGKSYFTKLLILKCGNG